MRWRLLCSILVLNLFPFLYGMGVLGWLGSFAYDTWNWECWLLILFTFWAGLGVFGFQRFYGLIAMWKPKILRELHCIMKEQVGDDKHLSKMASGISIAYYWLPIVLGVLITWVLRTSV